MIFIRACNRNCQILRLVGQLIGVRRNYVQDVTMSYVTLYQHNKAQIGKGSWDKLEKELIAYDKFSILTFKYTFQILPTIPLPESQNMVTIHT